MDILKKMKNRLLDVLDPESNYSQSDFDREFAVKPTNDSYKLNLDFVNKSNNPNPEYATDGSSGFDIRANLDENTLGILGIDVGERAIVPTGLFFEIPDNFEIQIRPRSGLAAKNGVTVLNTPGTIDSDYLGEIKVILINLGKEPFVIKHGDRIAQGVFAPAYTKKMVNLNQISELTKETERSSGGFGSTGVK